MIVHTVVQIHKASGSRLKLHLIKAGLAQRRQDKHMAEDELKTLLRKLGKVMKRLGDNGLTTDQLAQIAESSSWQVRDSLRPATIKPRKFARLCSLLCAYHIKRIKLEESIAGTKREIAELQALKERYTI